MIKQHFVITVGFLLSALWLINCQPSGCGQGHINVALVYDCRYDLRQQQDFFNKFIHEFEPLKEILSNNKAGDVKTDVNINLMTYTQSKLIILEKLTQENFSLDKFNEAAFNFNTSSCPQHLPLKTVFNDTREALGGYIGNVRKLAIFVLAENLTDYESDDTALRGLETEQGLNGDVKRLFILIKTGTRLKEKDLYSLYINTLNNSFELVKKSIGIICNPCHKNFDGFKHGTSCYHLTKDSNEKTASEADEICRQEWPGSHLVYMNSQSELDYLTSVKGIIKSNFDMTFTESVLDFWNYRRRFNDHYNYRGKSHQRRYITRTKEKIEIKGFIGLSSRQRNNPEEYTWNDGTPLVVDAHWGSRNKGQSCVYMSITYTSHNDVIRREHLQWNELDCNKPILTDFLLCESDMSDVEKILLNLKEITPKKQESYFPLLYTSYSPLLFSHINNEVQNNVTSLIKHKLSYNVTHKGFIVNSEESEDSRKNDISTQKTQIKQRKRYNCTTKTIENNLVLFNDESYIYGGVRCNEHNSKLVNEEKSHVRYLKGPSLTVQKCLYEVDYNRRRVNFPHISHLQDCEHFVCPPGFVKCPDSYCISVYLVNNDVKDCPHGEDEVSINYQKLCTGKLKFTLRNICLQKVICNANGQCQNHINDFVCQVPCDNGYVCVSNIIRKETGNDNTFYIRFVETIAQIYENLGVFTFTPQIYSLFQLFKLVEVDLSNRRMSDLDSVMKSLDSSDVIILDVSQNSISGHNNFSVIQEMENLQKLNMSFNKHLKLDENFIFPGYLQVLDLSDTQGGSGVIKNLINLINLKVLEIRNVEPIDLSLTGNVHLDIFDIRGTELIDIKRDYFSWLSIQTALYTDDFRICCQVIRGEKISENKCHAPRDAISTCQDLIGDPQKRVILWVVGILSLLGNIVVVIYRIIWDKAVFNKAYGLFVVCLGVSDLIMGVYLIIIAGADLLYRNMYVLEDTNWRYSNTCKLAGILSTFSSETSTMFICLITLDRYLAIKYPFGQHRFSTSGKMYFLCLTLIIGVVVSVIPVLFPGWEIYASNGMCLALPFSSERHTGWEYSAVLFVGLNFFLFILIAMGQFAIFIGITSYKGGDFSTRRDDSRKAQDLAVAKQLFLVALSDFCCWFPIGIMGIMSLNGFQFNLDVYSWSAVLVMPINSAINPLIYTLPAILRKIKSGHEVSTLTHRSIKRMSLDGKPQCTHGN